MSFKRLLNTAIKAKPFVDFRQVVDLKPADKHDFYKIIDMVLKTAIVAEPRAVALGMTREDVCGFFEERIGRALHADYSLMAHDKFTGELVGCRLLSVSHRDESLDAVPTVESEITDLETLLMTELLDDLNDKFFDVCDKNVNKVLRHELHLLNGKYRGQGLGQQILHEGLDLAQLRTSGFDGFVSDSYNMVTSHLFERNGYKVIAEASSKRGHTVEGRPFQFPDGSTVAHLFFRDMQTPLNPQL